MTSRLAVQSQRALTTKTDRLFLLVMDKLNLRTTKDRRSNPTTETQERAQFMSRPNLLEEVTVKSIFHPTDFSEASEVAFVHALKIALVAGATLTMLHVEARPSSEWQDFPRVRGTLERWRLIPMGSPKSVVGKARHQS